MKFKALKFDFEMNIFGKDADGGNFENIFLIYIFFLRGLLKSNSHNPIV